MLNNLTVEQLEARLDWVERIIANERDPKNLPSHNAMFQKIINRLAELDVAAQDAKESK